MKNGIHFVSGIKPEDLMGVFVVTFGGIFVCKTVHEVWFGDRMTPE